MSNHLRQAMASAFSGRKRIVPFVLSCLTLSAIILFSLFGDYQSALQPTRTSVLVSVTEDGRSAETLLLPVSRLVEPSLPSRSWFSGDPSCAHLRTRFGRPGSLPDARLASFGRSGNTWTRYLLEAASGLVTCGPTYDSEYLERPPNGALPAAADAVVYRKRSRTTAAEMRAAGFIAEHVSPLTRTCIVGKTHAFPPAWRCLEGSGEETGEDLCGSNSSTSSSNASYPLPAVLLVRDPFHAIIALRHLKTTNSMRAQINGTDSTAFSGSDWRRFVEERITFWVALADEWADGPRHTLLVPYERLVAEPAAQLRRMLRFLGVMPAPERLRCTLRHLEGAFHNKQHPVVPDEEVFDAAARRLVWFMIRQLDDKLASRGYQRLPVETYAFYHESETMV